jgi:HPt (histidine-containing phosphotransfer) domain-containing protein
MITLATVKVSSDLEPLIPKYLHNRRLDIEKAAKHLADNEMEPLRIIGHTMKGSGASYGFSFISEIGARIEIAAKESNSRSIQEALKEFEQFLDTVQVVFVEE